jgi:hypothetical protein
MDAPNSNQVMDRDELQRLTRLLARRRAKRGLFIALLFGLVWIAGHLYAGGLALAHSTEAAVELEGNLYATAVAPSRGEYRQLCQSLLTLPPLERLTASGDVQVILLLDNAPLDEAAPGLYSGALANPTALGSGERIRYVIHLHPVGLEPSVGPLELYSAAFGQAAAALSHHRGDNPLYSAASLQRLAVRAELLLAAKLAERDLVIDSSYQQHLIDCLEQLSPAPPSAPPSDPFRG